MPEVFLSYARNDRHFVELLETRLSGTGIDLWIDRGRLQAGTPWHQEIERAIAESVAVLVILSANSAESAYVTFEWAYALGQHKPIIPMKIEECNVHSRLNLIQYFDFTEGAPWKDLIRRLQEIDSEPDEAPAAKRASPEVSSGPKLDDTYAKAILTYLNQRGFQMVSFDRLREWIDAKLTDEQFMDIISDNPTVFRRARLKGGRPGIAKLIP